MKRVTWIILTGLCLTLLLVTDLYAEEVYSWKDQNGVLNISNRKPKGGIKVERVDRYRVPMREAPEVKAAEVKTDAGRDRRQAEIENAEKAAQLAEKEAEAARAFARETRKAVDEFRQKVGFKKKRLRKNRARIEQMEEQAALAEQQARAAEEVARAAKEAASALKQVPAPGSAAGTGP